MLRARIARLRARRSRRARAAQPACRGLPRGRRHSRPYPIGVASRRLQPGPIRRDFASCAGGRPERGRPLGPARQGARRPAGRHHPRQAPVRSLSRHRPGADPAFARHRYGHHRGSRDQRLLRHHRSRGHAAGVPRLLPQRRHGHGRHGRLPGGRTADGVFGDPAPPLRPGPDRERDDPEDRGGGRGVGGAAPVEPATRPRH